MIRGGTRAVGPDDAIGELLSKAFTVIQQDPVQSEGFGSRTLQCFASMLLAYARCREQLSGQKPGRALIENTLYLCFRNTHIYMEHTHRTQVEHRWNTGGTI